MQLLKVSKIIVVQVFASKRVSGVLVNLGKKVLKEDGAISLGLTYAHIPIGKKLYASSCSLHSEKCCFILRSTNQSLSIQECSLISYDMRYMLVLEKIVI